MELNSVNHGQVGRGTDNSLFRLWKSIWFHSLLKRLCILFYMNKCVIPCLIMPLELRANFSNKFKNQPKKKRVGKSKPLMINPIT